MIKAILFDMDGTLIDTEKYYRIYWKKASEYFGYPMTDEQALSMRSLGRPFGPEKLKEYFGPEVDYTKVREYRKVLMEPVLKEKGIEVKKGAEELLSWLKKTELVTAVVTASSLDRTKDYLGQVKLDSYFDILISAKDQKRGKPAPDVYKYACEQVGFKPEECIAVEDSPNGVLSAYHAGCKVVMVPDQTEPDEELKKLLWGVVDSLDKIKELLV